MKLPADHPQRVELNDEVHARPPEPLVAPARVSYLALLCDMAQREAGWAAVSDLCRRNRLEPPPQSVLHFSAQIGAVRVKWERHTEFIRFMFIIEGDADDAFEHPAIAELPADWVAAEALRFTGVHVDPALAIGVSIPVVAFLGIHHIRKTVTRPAENEHAADF